VDTGLRRQQPNFVGGNVGRVGDHDVDAAANAGRQRLEQVTVVDPSLGWEIAARILRRGRVDVGCEQFDLVNGRDQRGAHRARAAADVDDKSPWLAKGRRLLDQELGATTRHEDSRAHRYAQAAKVGPAENVFEGKAGGSPIDHGGEVSRGRCGGDEESGFLLGVDTAGGPKPGDDALAQPRRTGRAGSSTSGRVSVCASYGSP
jgi:hypothetical protein